MESHVSQCMYLQDTWQAMCQHAWVLICVYNGSSQPVCRRRRGGAGKEKRKREKKEKKGKGKEREKEEGGQRFLP